MSRGRWWRSGGCCWRPRTSECASTARCPRPPAPAVTPPSSSSRICSRSCTRPCLCGLVWAVGQVDQCAWLCVPGCCGDAVTIHRVLLLFPYVCYAMWCGVVWCGVVILVQGTSHGRADSKTPVGHCPGPHTVCLHVACLACAERTPKPTGVHDSHVGSCGGVPTSGVCPVPVLLVPWVRAGLVPRTLHSLTHTRVHAIHLTFARVLVLAATATWCSVSRTMRCSRRARRCRWRSWSRCRYC